MTSRTQYSARNTTASILSVGIGFILGYVCRIVFIQCLASEYVGVNGLFTDILNVLALSELGMSGAITFALYKPIADNDTEKIKALMDFYRKLYMIVAGVVAVLGLMVVPFLNYLIKDELNIEHLVLIYLLYLLNTVVSYFLIYKVTLLEATQRGYINQIYIMIYLIVQYSIQIVVLYLTKNFILYLLIYIVCTIARNVTISIRTDKLYPYLKEKNITPLDKGELRGIKKNIFAMFLHKLGTVVVNNTDNLIISAFVGIIDVGIYSNYFLIIASIQNLCNFGMRGISASVGNLTVTENNDRIKKVYDGTVFIGQVFYGVCALCLYEGLAPFMELSFGEGYVFGKWIELILCVNFLMKGFTTSSQVFSDAMGLFWNIRFKPIAEAVINLVVSIVLVRFLGIIGVFLGTFVSNLLTGFWVEPMIVNKKIGGSLAKYFLRLVIFLLVFLAAGFGADRLCALVNGPLILVFIARVIICLFVVIAVVVLVYHRTENFKFLWGKAKDLIRNRIKRTNER